MVKLVKHCNVDLDISQNSMHSLGSKKNNPFEVHKNKEKFQILGQQIKHSRGLPGISKKKAFNKRKETLGKEFIARNKVNKFLDRRIAVDLEEETSNIRFSELKRNKLKNKRFDSNTEVLTHKSITLEVEELKFRNEFSDESEIDEDFDENFSKMAFGGGKGIINTDRKTALQNFIIETKRRKIKFLSDKVDVFKMTTHLDEKYKNLLPELGMLNVNNLENKSQIDDYDKLMRSMIFEPRGEVTDKLKIKEETSKLEKKKMEALMNERLTRMKGDENDYGNSKRITADDLENVYFVESIEDVNKNQFISDIKEPFKSEQLKDLKTDKSKIKISDESEEYLYALNQKKNTNTTIGTKLKPNFSLKNEIGIICQLTSSFPKFLTLLQGKDPKIQSYVVQKLIENNHPKLDVSNHKKIAQLFEKILRFLTLEFRNFKFQTSFKTLDEIIPHLFDMIKINPKCTTECFLELIKKYYELYKRDVKKIPNIETIFIFKIISNLYSTSDFHHPIVTPSVIFINQILTESFFESRRDISLGLFLVTIMLEFTNFSKRFLPACFNFLLGILTLAVPKSIDVNKIVQPFKNTAETTARSILLLEEKNASYFEKKLNALDLINDNNIDNDFKISTLNIVFKLLIEYANIMNNGSIYIFEQFLKLMERLNLNNYPDFVKENYVETKRNIILILNIKLSRLIARERKPKFLRLLEPKIEKISDVKRRPKISEEKRMRAIMIHKVKRESKGAEREIRKDTQFLNKIKIKYQIQRTNQKERIIINNIKKEPKCSAVNISKDLQESSGKKVAIKLDLERKEKVKKIFAEASIQQGELNALKRQRDQIKY